MQIFCTPSANSASASLSLAVQIPIAPAANCSLAMSADLWVLACGRAATFGAGQARAHGGDVLIELVEIEHERRRVEIPFRDALAHLRIGDMGHHLGSGVPIDSLGNPEHGGGRSGSGQKITAGRWLHKLPRIRGMRRSGPIIELPPAEIRRNRQILHRLQARAAPKALSGWN